MSHLLRKIVQFCNQLNAEQAVLRIEEDDAHQEGAGYNTHDDRFKPNGSSTKYEAV